MKVRFNLGKQNYKQWQVYDGKNKRYYNPDEVTLKLTNCKLHNNPKVAQKIFNGSHKTVCSWIKCEAVEVIPISKVEGKTISYNPRIKPHWCDSEGNNIDNHFFSSLVTNGRKVYTT